jgi:putative colanic acid biosysnthesis UDP-glucose lipid carrier transferase
MLKHTDDYSKLIQQFMIRHFVKPGVTGWAQVNGYRGETTRLTQMEGRVKHDLWYAENWSLWLDVRIVFLTVWTTVKGDKQAF